MIDMEVGKTKRHKLTDEQWQLVEPLIPKSRAKTGRKRKDPRLMLNGLMVDIAGLAEPAGLTLATLGNCFCFMVGSANDPLSWTMALAPAQVLVRAGERESSSDRVTIIWADNAVENTWLLRLAISRPLRSTFAGQWAGPPGLASGTW